MAILFVNLIVLFNQQTSEMNKNKRTVILTNHPLIILFGLKLNNWTLSMMDNVFTGLNVKLQAINIIIVDCLKM